MKPLARARGWLWESIPWEQRVVERNGEDLDNEVGEVCPGGVGDDVPGATGAKQGGGGEHQCGDDSSGHDFGLLVSGQQVIGCNASPVEWARWWRGVRWTDNP